MKNNLLNVIGTLMMAFNQWVQIILITRILGLYEVGLYSYFLAILAPIVLLSRFSFSFLIPTQKKYNYSYYVYNKFRQLCNYVFIILMIVFIAILDLNSYEIVCLSIFTLFKFFENKEEYIFTENISKNNIEVLAYSKILKSMITLFLFTISISIFESLLLGILSLLISQILIYYLYDIKYKHRNNLSEQIIRKGQFKNIFLLGIGLTIVGVATSLSSTIPRYILEEIHGREALGIYATIAYFSLIANNIIIALNQSFISSLVIALSNNIFIFLKKFSQIFLVYIGLIFIGLLMLIIFGNDFLIIIYGNQFVGYNKELILVGVQIVLFVIFKLFEMSLNVLNLYKAQVIIQSITFILTILISLPLINVYGIIGAFLVSITIYTIAIISQIIMFIYKVHKIK